MWQLKTFNELTTFELEQIYKLRQSIFIVEQQSYFHDIDGLDQLALHLFNKENGVIWSYCRILDNVSHITFGRVTVHKERRGKGNGRILLNKVFDVLNEKYPDKDIHIIAMSYLKSFYESIGFVAVSKEYVLDQHPHIDMVFYRN